MIPTVKILLGDWVDQLRALPAKSVQCCVNLFALPLFQLQRSELLKYFVCRRLKFGRHSISAAWRGKRSPEGVHLKTQFNTSPFALNERKNKAQKPEAVLLAEPQSVIRRPPPTGETVNYFCGRQKRINKLYRRFVGHCEFKSDDIARAFSACFKRFLNPDVSLGVNHRRQISDLPLL